jgi:hypothetical protein
MARSRNIKPAIMDNEILAELEPLTRLLFIYLWMLADREGRLEDRPKRIAAKALPYDRAADVDSMLADLCAAGFIERYVVDGKACIQVTRFAKHQAPHVREIASELPCNVPGTTQVVTKHDLGSAEAVASHRLDRLIPDSGFLIPDSLIPDCSNPNPDSGESTSADLPREPAREPQPRATRLPADWTLPEKWAQWAISERSDLDAAKVAEKFRDFWCAKAGNAALKLDWQATWRNWVRDEHPPPVIKVGRQLETFKERDARLARAWYDEMTGKTQQPTVIDMVTDLVEANSQRAIR